MHTTHRADCFRQMKVAVVALAVLASFSVAMAGESDGRLIVQKVINTEYPGLYARGKQINITLNTYNVGGGCVAAAPWPLIALSQAVVLCGVLRYQLPLLIRPFSHRISAAVLRMM